MGISEQTLIRITSKNKQTENTSLTMKKYILQLLLIMSFGYCMALPAKSQESCRVREKGTNKLMQCEFPFKYKGETLYGCIDWIDIKDGKKVSVNALKNGKPWGSTKVSGPDREHVSGGGHFGDCDSSCPKVEEQTGEQQEAAKPIVQSNQIRTPLATQAVFVDDPSNPNGRTQLIIESQLCIAKKGYRNSTMNQWCQENCLKYPPNCDPNLCECIDECKAVGDLAGKEWSDFDCNENCIRYPFSSKDCPEDKCRCSFLKPEPEVKLYYSPDPNSAQ